MTQHEGIPNEFISATVETMISVFLSFNLSTMNHSIALRRKLRSCSPFSRRDPVKARSIESRKRAALTMRLEPEGQGRGRCLIRTGARKRLFFRRLFE